MLGLNWPFIPALLGGGLAAALLALIVGLLALNRLRSDYFAIVTVAVSLVLYTFSERLYRSPFGRALRSVREGEMVAQGLGKNVFALRLKAFVIGAFIAGIGGSMLVIYVDAFNPSAWTTGETFFLWAALLLGGSANNRGAMLGALIVPVLFAEITRFLPAFGSPQLVNAFRYIAIGVLLILTVRFRPQGILAEKRFRVRKSKLQQLEPALASASAGVHITDADLANDPGILTDGTTPVQDEEGKTL